eukprot:4883870-Prymnesium_polylepis.2
MQACKRPHRQHHELRVIQYYVLSMHHGRLAGKEHCQPLWSRSPWLGIAERRERAARAFGNAMCNIIRA